MAGFLRYSFVIPTCQPSCLYVHMQMPENRRREFLNYILGKICRQLDFLKIWDKIMAT